MIRFVLEFCDILNILSVYVSLMADTGSANQWIIEKRGSKLAFEMIYTLRTLISIHFPIHEADTSKLSNLADA